MQKSLNKLRSFLTLGVIIAPLPNNIVDGTIIDAVPVMANFNWIVQQVNANAAAGNIANASSIPTFVPSGSVTGTANAIALAPVPTIAAYAAGQRFSFPAGGSNTGAVTVATNGLSARALKYADGTNLTGGELITGGVYDIEDNGANYILMNSSQGGGIVSWTPVLSFGGASVGIAYASQTGTAIKINRMVYYSFFIQLTSKGSSTGQARIGGLPYTINSGWQGDNGGPLFSDTLTYSGQCMIGYITGGTSMNILNCISAGAVTALSDTAFANTTQIASGALYPT